MSFIQVSMWVAGAPTLVLFLLLFSNNCQGTRSEVENLGYKQVPLRDATGGSIICYTAMTTSHYIYTLNLPLITLSSEYDYDPQLKKNYQ